jgi:hypothetical protein
MGRLMTLRGAEDIRIGRATAFGSSSENRIFAYESSDRTKAWRVIRAYFWVQRTITGTAGGDNRACLSAALATDSLGTVAISDVTTAQEWIDRMGAGDNRTIAWAQQDYQMRDNTDGDMIFCTSGMRNQAEFICDADRLLTNELWLTTYGLTETTNLDTQINYYIELEEMKVTPSQSVFQQIKGIGQDIDE